MKAIGSATANQLSQETELPPLPISWMAKIFCGDEMGLVMPPRLDAKAIPAVASLHLHMESFMDVESPTRRFHHQMLAVVTYLGRARKC